MAETNQTTQPDAPRGLPARYRAAETGVLNGRPSKITDGDLTWLEANYPAELAEMVEEKERAASAKQFCGRALQAITSPTSGRVHSSRDGAAQ